MQVPSEKDIDDAVAAAKKAQPAWAALSGWQRAAIMLKFADLLDKNADKLARLEGIAMGQPITLARAFVKRPVDLWRYYAGYCGKLPGEVVVNLVTTFPTFGMKNLEYLCSGFYFALRAKSCLKLLRWRYRGRLYFGLVLP